jgi:AcrR family transcriptional regulator
MQKHKNNNHQKVQRKEIDFMGRNEKNTKQKSVQESMKLFSIQGFDAVSIRTIAQAVGVRNSALYKHFKSKREILDEIISYLTEYYMDAANKVIIKIKSMEDLQTVSLIFRQKMNRSSYFADCLFLSNLKTQKCQKLIVNFLLNYQFKIHIRNFWENNFIHV